MELVTNQPVDAAGSLLGGQAHRWRRDEAGDGWLSGVVCGHFIKVRQSGPSVEFRSNPGTEEMASALLRSHLRLDDDLPAIYAEICRDSRVRAMVARHHGLRVLRIEPWECLVSFICSANSNIRRIHNNVESLARSYGEAVDLDGQERHAFPTPEKLAQAGEKALRDLGLGFRAPYVDQAAKTVAAGRLDLNALVGMPYDEAKAVLMECRGIGPKVADCIALFSLEKTEAFPIDVWVRRALGEWYFPGQKTPTDQALLQWARDYFGRYAGYANQYLFHGKRLEKQAPRRGASRRPAEEGEAVP